MLNKKSNAYTIFIDPNISIPVVNNLSDKNIAKWNNFALNLGTQTSQS